MMKQLIILTLFVFQCCLCFGQRQHLVFEATFENNNDLLSFDSAADCGNRISVVDNIKRYGNKAVRFELVANDSTSCGNLRSQLMKNGGPVNYSSWYGFSVYFADGYPNNYDGIESFFQIYRTDSEFMPPLTFNYEGFYNGVDSYPSGKYITLTQSLISPDSVVDESLYTIYHYPLDTIKFNTWVDIVVNVKWSDDSTGYIKVWVNNDLAFIYAGVNNYTSNYLRVGPDKEDWRKRWNISSTGRRVIYFDEIRVGNAQANFIDVLPGGGGIGLPLRETPVRPTEREPTPFTVVNPVRSGVLQFQIPATRNEQMSYELIDINGRTLMRSPLSIIRGQNYKEINVKHLVKGMYFLAIQSQQGLTVKKIIIN